MKRWGLIALLTILSSAYAANIVKPMGNAHVRESKARADGKFDIVCMDGEAEVRTQEEISAGVVCVHIEQRDSAYTLSTGGVDDSLRFCDLDVFRLMSRQRVLKLEAHFKAPCDIPANRTEDCNGAVCNLRLGETFYTFEFLENETLVMTRLKDGLSGTYVSGTVNSGEGQTRIAEVNSVAGILQIKRPGQEWMSVCDDDFDEVDAEIACREMGYERVDRFQIAVYVGNDEDYGMDDLRCEGSERSIHMCPHSDATSENCSASEHVRLICTN